MEILRIYNGGSQSAWQYINPVKMAVSLYRNRDLLSQFVWREVSTRYRGSVLGIFWSVFNPLLMLCVYTFVFSQILKVRWDVDVADNKFEFALTLFAGMIINNAFVECLCRAPSIIISNPNYVKKVVFPIEILSVSAVFSTLIFVAISLAVLVVSSAILTHHLSFKQLLIIPVLLPALLITVGATWWLAALGVYLRDIGQIIGVLMQIFTYSTPVFYPLSAVPERYRGIVLLNPMTAVIDGARQVLLWNNYPDWHALVYSFIFGFLVLQTGYMFFMKAKRGFGDVL